MRTAKVALILFALLCASLLINWYLYASWRVERQRANLAEHIADAYDRLKPFGYVRALPTDRLGRFFPEAERAALRQSGLAPHAYLSGTAELSSRTRSRPRLRPAAAQPKPMAPHTHRAALAGRAGRAQPRPQPSAAATAPQLPEGQPSPVSPPGCACIFLPWSDGRLTLWDYNPELDELDYELTQRFKIEAWLVRDRSGKPVLGKVKLSEIAQNGEILASETISDVKLYINISEPQKIAQKRISAVLWGIGGNSTAMLGAGVALGKLQLGAGVGLAYPEDRIHKSWAIYLGWRF